MMQSHGLLLFLCSCVPGCGQMKQGYMKRGVSLLCLFWGVAWICNVLYYFRLEMLMIPLWLYTFFDSYDLRSRAAAGLPREDEFFFGFSELDVQKSTLLLQKRHSLVGWALVGFGLYMLYQQLMEHLSHYVYNYLEHLVWLYDLLRYSLPRVVVSIAIIALGVWFLRGPKEKAPHFAPEAAEEVPYAESPGEEDDHGAD